MFGTHMPLNPAGTTPKPDSGKFAAGRTLLFFVEITILEIGTATKVVGPALGAFEIRISNAFHMPVILEAGGSIRPSLIGFTEDRDILNPFNFAIELEVISAKFLVI